MKYELLVGSPTQRRKAIEKVASGDAQMLIAGYAGLSTFSRLAPYGSIKLARCAECGSGQAKPVRPASCEYHERELNKIDWQVVIADEAHRMKDPTTKWTRALKWIARKAPYRYALTGTPTADSMGDLWSLLNFINPDEWPTKTGYIDRYADLVPSLWGPPEIIGIRPDTEAELRQTLDARMLRHIKAVVLPQLPPKVYEERTFTLSPKEAKAYAEMKKGLITDLESGQLTAWNHLEKSIRLSQLASSALHVEKLACPKCEGTTLFDGDTCPKCNGIGMIDEVTPIEPSSKLDAVDEALEATNEPLVLFYVSRKLLELHAARLAKRGVSFGVVTGHVSEEERQIAVDAFQTGQLRLLLMTVATGAEGWTLTRASTAFFVQRPWSFIQSGQSEDRLHRIGAEGHESITYVDFTGEATIDEDVRETLVEKHQSFEGVVHDKERVAWLQ